MRADAEHDQPVWSLRPLITCLRITQTLDIHRTRLLNVICSTVPHEHGLSTPFDNDALSLGNAVEGKNIGRGERGGAESCDGEPMEPIMK